MSSIRSILEELRYDIEDVCDDKYVGWVKPVEELSARIDGLVDQALKEISELHRQELEKEVAHWVTEANLNYDLFRFRIVKRLKQLQSKKELLK